MYEKAANTDKVCRYECPRIKNRHTSSLKNNDLLTPQKMEKSIYRYHENSKSTRRPQTLFHKTGRFIKNDILAIAEKKHPVAHF